uniref:hypothetical protein n=1 Tax=Rhodanobacter glycinis TaxID=582702 RepID=UPI00209C2903|nr:hypothetical protein [Rhodanobacter glycinis]
MKSIAPAPTWTRHRPALFGIGGLLLVTTLLGACSKQADAPPPPPPRRRIMSPWHVAASTSKAAC